MQNTTKTGFWQNLSVPIYCLGNIMISAPHYSYLDFRKEFNIFSGEQLSGFRYYYRIGSFTVQTSLGAQAGLGAQSRCEASS